MANKKKKMRKAKAWRKKLRQEHARATMNLDEPEIYRYTLGRTQPRPFIKPLAYQRSETKFRSGPHVIRTSLANHAAFRAHGNDYVSNKALSKVYDQLGQVESLRVAWIERQKALDLVTSSVRTLITVVRAVKRRDPRIVRAVLKRNPNAKDIVKTPSGLWLQYHFGWKPTVMDIHHGMDLLAQPLPPLKVEGSSSGQVAINTIPLRNWVDPFDGAEGFNFTVMKTCKIGVSVTGVDANVNLATSLGFGQPLSVAWELQPFSWLVDYMVNVGEYLKNFEPRFPGLSLSNQYMTTLVKGNVMYGSRWDNWVFGPWTAQYTYDHFSMVRELTLPPFALTFTSPSDLKGQQASYVVAVFLPMLVGLKK